MHLNPTLLCYRGLNKQGYQCRRKYKAFPLYPPYSLHWIVPPEITSGNCLFSECNAAIHKKCIDKVIAKCTGSAINSRETMVLAQLDSISWLYLFQQVRLAASLSTSIATRASGENKLSRNWVKWTIIICSPGYFSFLHLQEDVIIGVLLFP